MTVLKVSGLTKNFGGLAAVSNVNLEIEERELIWLIGPNGAGKTTLFNLLTGVYDPREGTECRRDDEKHRRIKAVCDHRLRPGADVSEYPAV